MTNEHGLKFREMREKLGLSGYKAASLMGKNRRTIYYWEYVKCPNDMDILLESIFNKQSEANNK